VFGVYFLFVLLSGQLDVSGETTSSELGERNALGQATQAGAP